jgi:hypothetical protein
MAQRTSAVSVRSLEELDGALVPLGCGPAGKRAEVAPTTGPAIDLS